MLVTSRIIALALAVGLAVLPPSATAQESNADQKIVRKVVRVEHLNAEEVAGLLHEWISVSASRPLRAVALAGPPDRVEEAVRVIAEMDVPFATLEARTARDVDLTLHLVAAVEDEGEAFTASPLRAVVEQLRAQFPHHGYRLLDSVAIRGRDQRMLQVGGALPRSIDSQDSRVNYDVQVGLAPAEKGATSVQIQRLTFKMYRSGGSIQVLAEMDTRLTIPTDKLVVVGKAGVDDPLMEGLFVVLSARVVE